MTPKKLTHFAMLLTLLTVSLPLYSAIPQQAITMNVISQNLTISKNDIVTIKLLQHPHGVDITLTENAAMKLKKLTSENIKKTLQISVDDKIISSPVIQGAIGKRFVLPVSSEQLAKQIFHYLS